MNNFNNIWKEARMNLEQKIVENALNYLSESKLSIKLVMQILQNDVDLLTSFIQSLNSFNPRYFDFMNEEMKGFKKYGFVSSSYKLFKYLEENELYFAPEAEYFNERGEIVHHEDEGLEFSANKSFMRITKIKKIYSALFNQTTILNDIVERINEIEKDEFTNGPNIISNIIQGSVWKKFMAGLSVEQKNETLYLPYLLYYDDLQILNQMSVHVQDHKIGVIFGKIGVLPKSIQAKLEAIQLLGVFYAKDIKELSVEYVFSKIIKILQDLANEGIELAREKRFKFKNQTIKRIKLVTIIMIGDNLGIHIAHSFIASFGTAMYVCYKCYTDKDQRKGK